ncbi:MAG: PAS domain S-box protein [Spirochaetes bacterium]|nr:PAS domain S-box protein [Spirochaetota bacterium]MBU1079125.1 PAS domain S-box protein [Spirochaetota bacterium]
MPALLELDIHTILVLLVVGNASAVATLVVYQWKLGLEPSVRRYVAGASLQAAAWTLLYLRGVVPAALSIHVGNAALISGFGLECLALSTSDAPSARKDAAYALIASIGIAVFLAFAGSAPNIRVFVASIVSIGPYAALSFFMFRGRGGLHAFIGLVSAFYCLVLAARAAASAALGPEFSLFTSAFIQTLAFVPLFLFKFVSTIGFILLIKERSDMLLAESEEKFRTLVERASEAIIIIQDELVVYGNPKAASLLGLGPAELVGRGFLEFVWPGDRTLVLDYHRSRVSGGSPPDAYDMRLLDAAGEAHWLSVSSAIIQWGGRMAIMGLLTDIDARKRSESQVARLLAEKETLLREVHHRIKNNLAVASSLLSLQSAFAEGKDPSVVLIDARNRLRSLAQLYDLMNAKGSYARASMKDFLSALASDLADVLSSSASSAPTRFDLDIDDLELDADRLATLGLIVNEIVTNSMKYAFAGIADPRVSITASARDGTVRVLCGDNGTGLVMDEARRAGTGLGLQLIESLASQLGASIRVETEGGTRYAMEFPAEAPGRG